MLRTVLTGYQSEDGVVVCDSGFIVHESFNSSYWCFRAIKLSIIMQATKPMQIIVRVAEIILQWLVVSKLIAKSTSTNCKNFILVHVLNISNCLLIRKNVLSIFLVLILLQPFFSIHTNWFFSFLSTSQMCMECKVWRTITCQLRLNTLVLQASNVKGISELFQ